MVSKINSDKADITLYTDPFNRRIRVDDYNGSPSDVFLLIVGATPAWAEKLIVKTRTKDILFFQSHAFRKEGYVKEYFNGEDMHFLVKYFSVARGSNLKEKEEEQILEKILSEKKFTSCQEIDKVSLAIPEDAQALADLYKQIFKVYPTPLGNADHVRKTMTEDTRYVVIRDEGRIISAASAEINQHFGNAELTDCATLPEAQGKGHMKKLLLKLEEVLIKEEIHCLYTIARAESYGMNKVFHQLGYTYGGRLINNCLIYSGLEDMNVWYKLTR